MKKLTEENMAELDGAIGWIYADGDLPDGAWFAMLEEGAKAFLKSHKIRMDENTATHEYLEWKSNQGEQK